MARKVQPFAIYEDARARRGMSSLEGGGGEGMGRTSLDVEEEEEQEEDEGQLKEEQRAYRQQQQEDERRWSTDHADHDDHEQTDAYAEEELDELEDLDAPPDRRESTFTSASISSFPESTAFATDNETGALSQPLSTGSRALRPSFMRPEHVRRMRMVSPPPLGSEKRARRAGRGARSSPRPKSKQKEAEAEAEGDSKHYPLVLLHVTVLPIDVPWSTAAMGDVLDAGVLDGLRVLRAKVTSRVLHRGILVPHPREDYELLEERVLEALELQEGRLTSCGHFRARESCRAEVEDEEARDSDSGVGSSVDGSEGGVCETCNHHLKGSSGRHGRRRKWSIKAYAANGLMRAPTWSAAWPEMERVDVEILPWISDKEWQALDEWSEDGKMVQSTTDDNEDTRMREIAKEQARLAQEDRERGDMEERLLLEIEAATQEAKDAMEHDSHTDRPEASNRPNSDEAMERRTTDLPNVYKPSQIPLSVLLKNYICLLAQDRRVSGVLFVVVIGLLFLLRSVVVPIDSPLVSVEQAVNSIPPLIASESQTQGAAVLDSREQNSGEKVVPQLNDSIPDHQMLSDDSIPERLVERPSSSEELQGTLFSEALVSAHETKLVEDAANSAVTCSNHASSPWDEMISLFFSSLGEDSCSVRSNSPLEELTGVFFSADKDH